MTTRKTETQSEIERQGAENITFKGQRDNLGKLAIGKIKSIMKKDKPPICIQYRSM